MLELVDSASRTSRPKEERRAFVDGDRAKRVVKINAGTYISFSL